MVGFLSLATLTIPFALCDAILHSTSIRNWLNSQLEHQYSSNNITNITYSVFRTSSGPRTTIKAPLAKTTDLALASELQSWYYYFYYPLYTWHFVRDLFVSKFTFAESYTESTSISKLWLTMQYTTIRQYLVQTELTWERVDLGTSWPQT